MPSFVDHPDMPGALAVQRPDGSFSPPLAPQMAMQADPAGYAAYKAGTGAAASMGAQAGGTPAGVTDIVGPEGEALRIAPSQGPSLVSPGLQIEIAPNAPPPTAPGAINLAAVAERPDAVAAGNKVVQQATRGDRVSVGGGAGTLPEGVTQSLGLKADESAGAKVPKPGAVVGQAQGGGTFNNAASGAPAATGNAGSMGLNAYNTATQQAAAITDAMIAQELAKRPSAGKFVKEHDQKLGYTITAERGPDQDVYEKKWEGMLGQKPLVPEPKPQLEMPPQAILDKWAPPQTDDGAGNKRDMTPKEKLAWAAGIAAQMKDGSVSAAALDTQYEPSLTTWKPPPRMTPQEVIQRVLPSRLNDGSAPANMTPAQKMEWARNTAAEINAANDETSKARFLEERKAGVAKIDSSYKQAVDERDMRVAGQQRERELIEKKFGGPNGLAQFAMKEAEIDRDAAERAVDPAVQAAHYERQFGDAQQQLLNRERDAYADLDAKIKAVSEKAAVEVDPKRYWKDKSAGEKVLLVLAGMFGGAGAALAKQPNLAAAALEKSVNEDIDAQKTNIANAKGNLNQLQGLYQDVAQRYGSERAGMLAMKSARLGGLESQLRASIASATSEKARVAAEKTLAFLTQAKAEADMELSRLRNGQISTQFKTVPGQMVGGSAGPDLKKALALANSKREMLGSYAKDEASINKDAAASDPMSKAVTFSYGGQTLAFRPNIPEAIATDTLKTVQATPSIHKNLDMLIEQQKNKLTGHGRIDGETALAIILPTAAQLNSSLGGGAMSKDELANWQAALVDQIVGRSASEGRMVIHQAVENIINAKLNAVVAGRVEGGRIIPYGAAR